MHGVYTCNGRLGGGVGWLVVVDGFMMMNITCLFARLHSTLHSIHAMFMLSRGLGESDANVQIVARSHIMPLSVYCHLSVSLPLNFPSPCCRQVGRKKGGGMYGIDIVNQSASYPFPLPLLLTICLPLPSSTPVFPRRLLLPPVVAVVAERVQISRGHAERRQDVI